MSSTFVQSTHPTNPATTASAAEAPVKSDVAADPLTSAAAGPIPDVSHLVTEDDTPVDNLIQEKLQRFLVESLYSSLKRGIPFLAAADVGIFYGLKQENSIVPDVMLSLGVSVPEDWSEQRKRSYFIWEFGKPPDVAIEIVSNKKGGELESKLQDYARIGIPYYVVFDPLEKLSPEILQIYQLRQGRYQRLQENWLQSLELGLIVWEGEFETKQYDRWLRWCDSEGNLLLTGNEKAQQAEEKLEQAEQQIAQERQRAEQERQRAERLAELLRSHNIAPDE